MRYLIIGSTDLQIFEELVQSAINDGCKLQGGVSQVMNARYCEDDEISFTYIQAVTSDD